MGVLCIWRAICVLCSLGSGVESDSCVLDGLMWRLFAVVQEAISLMYG